MLPFQHPSGMFGAFWSQATSANSVSTGHNVLKPQAERAGFFIWMFWTLGMISLVPAFTIKKLNLENNKFMNLFDNYFWSLKSLPVPMLVVSFGYFSCTPCFDSLVVRQVSSPRPSPKLFEVPRQCTSSAPHCGVSQKNNWTQRQLTCNIPSRELTYPTWGKGKTSSKVPWERIMLVPRRAHTIYARIPYKTTQYDSWITWCRTQ